ncbi:zinc finger protein 724-like isoform X1 [Mytilus californianus]|uniref:zinc finger protein 724-like isoform X1 n=2 Tax=Mytilus californianus TaxID=6549 RepID=UPI0022469ECF|nr:zinc finger protein 724-like isoform X1 [Mytilus californianus]
MDNTCPNQDETKQSIRNIEQASVTPLLASKKENHQGKQLQVLTKGSGNNGNELVSFETEEDIWKAAGKMCERLQDLGRETVIMSVNKQRETIRCEASTVGQNFLDTNPKCLQKFKDFCMASDNEISPSNTDGPVMFINTTDFDGNDSNMSNGSSYRDNHSGSTTEIDEEHNVDYKSKRNDLVDGVLNIVKTKLRKFNTKMTNGKKRYACDICNKEFSKLSNVQRHKKVHEKNKSFSCVTCNSGFTELGKLQKHIQQHKDDDSLEKGSTKNITEESEMPNDKLTRQKSYSCSICRKNFKNSTSLRIHENRHKGIKPYKCGECDKSFSSSGNLSAHKKIHSSDKAYMCTVCGKQYNQHSEFLIHERNHRNERPFACKYCDKTFSRSGCLHNHERIHTGVKPYLCGTCGKAFSRSDRLHIHERCHSGEKPFMCNVCGKVYSDMSNLRSHKKTHDGQLHYCNICGKGFVYKTGLNRHEREKHDVKMDEQMNDAEDFETIYSTEVNESIKEMYEKQNFEKVDTTINTNEKTDKSIGGTNLTKVLPMKGNLKNDELSDKGYFEKVDTTIKMINAVEEIGRRKNDTVVRPIKGNQQINEKRSLEKVGGRTVNDKINEMSKQAKLEHVEKVNMMKKNKQIEKIADSANLEKNHTGKMNKQINELNERAAFEKDNFIERNETMEAVNEVMNFENPAERRNFYHHLYGSLLAGANAMHNTYTMNR